MTRAETDAADEDADGDPQPEPAGDGRRDDRATGVADGRADEGADASSADASQSIRDPAAASPSAGLTAGQATIRRMGNDELSETFRLSREVNLLGWCWLGMGGVALILGLVLWAVLSRPGTQHDEWEWMVVLAVGPTVGGAGLLARVTLAREFAMVLCLPTLLAPPIGTVLAWMTLARLHQADALFGLGRLRHRDLSAEVAIRVARHKARRAAKAAKRKRPGAAR